MADADRLKRTALGIALASAFMLPTEAAYALVFYILVPLSYGVSLWRTVKLRRNKSLFASFSSEKEESLVLFLKKKNQKDFYFLSCVTLVFLLVVWSALTLIWGEGTGRRATQLLLAAAATAVFVAAGLDVVRGLALGRLLALCCAGNACLSLALGAPFALRGERMLGWGITRQPILGGSVMAVGCLTAMMLARTEARRWFWVPAAGVMGAFILAMDSRGALLGFAAGACVLLWPALNRRLLAAALLAALGVAVVLAALPAVRQGLAAAWVARGDSHRLAIWRDSLAAIGARPLFGHGLAAALPFSPTGFPHSLYLSLLFYSGVVGLGLFLAMMRCLGALLARSPAGTERDWVLALLLNALVAGLTDFSQITKGPGPLWIIFWLPVILALRLGDGGPRYRARVAS